jgi:hypothetical protein
MPDVEALIERLPEELDDLKRATGVATRRRPARKRGAS